MNWSKIQGYVSVALGIVLIIVGVMQRNKRKKLLEQGIEVEGEIFDVPGNGKNGASGYPVIRFVTKDMVTVSEKYKVRIPIDKKGKKVKLIYSAVNPKEFIVKEII